MSVYLKLGRTSSYALPGTQESPALVCISHSKLVLKTPLAMINNSNKGKSVVVLVIGGVLSIRSSQSQGIVYRRATTP